MTRITASEANMPTKQSVNLTRITVNYHEFICGQKVVRCVSMA
jgi:hypothetical protein